jgi:hypothetical protein
VEIGSPKTSPKRKSVIENQSSLTLRVTMKNHIPDDFTKSAGMIPIQITL